MRDLHCHVLDRLALHRDFEREATICVFDASHQNINMSGAEAAGLAVGVIALASLFTTCAELLEYFELGKNHRYDYDLACTKVNLLHKRLSIWGRSTHIQDPDNGHPVLQHSVERDTISKSLHALKAILADTDGLRRKYALNPVTRATLDTSHQDQSRRFLHWSLQVRRRTAWSIRDKAKFDRFIEDISFFIENLERVTDKSSEMAPQNTSRQLDPNKTSDSLTLPKSGPPSQQSLIPRRAPNGTVAVSGSQDHSLTGSTLPATGASAGHTMPNAWAERVHSTSGVYTDSNNLKQQSTDSQWSFQGALFGPEGGVHVVRDSVQINERGAGGFQGAASQESALRLQQQANDAYYANNPGNRK